MKEDEHEVTNAGALLYHKNHFHPASNRHKVEVQRSAGNAKSKTHCRRLVRKMQFINQIVHGKTFKKRFLVCQVRIKWPEKEKKKSGSNARLRRLWCLLLS